jgi:hypothetical protein
MLNHLKALHGNHIHASDGLIGTLHDFYFDDAQWILRYLVVDLGNFIHGRKVLISPVAIVGIDAASQTVSLKHSKDQIKNSPDINVDKPVYRQLEEQLLNYYEWVAHWAPQHDLPEPQTQAVPMGDTHLRSMNNVCKYTVMAFDGRVGSITDFILDDNGWRLPLMVLDTGHYLPADKVVIPTTRLKGIRVEDKEISIDTNKAEIAKAPRYDPTRPLEEFLKSAV